MNFSGKIMATALLAAAFTLPLAQEAKAGPNDNITPISPSSSAAIDNGLIQLGINDEGHLNVDVGLPPSAGGTGPVGLRYLPTNNEATAPGCLCEGWGVANATTGLKGYANRAVDGVVNLDLVSFTSTASTAQSIVTIDGSLKVTHDFKPSASANLYEAVVTIENIGASIVGDLRYRRVMDWDVEPTAFSEFVTIQGTAAATNVLFASNNGFASADPLSGNSDLGFTGDFVDAGPLDHGALFDFGFGALGVGKSKQFSIFYGAAGTEAGALAALATVGAEVYSFGQPNTLTGASIGDPNTFIFAFKGVGGDPIAIPEPLTMLGAGTALGFGSFFKKKLARKQQK